MAVLEVSVVPLGTSTPSVSKFLAAAIEVVEDSGLVYRLGPMSTCIEGPLNEIVDVAVQMHQACFSEDVRRVVTRITIDDRQDKELTMDSKTETVRPESGCSGPR